MSFPKILQELFQKNGGGDKLRPEILPDEIDEKLNQLDATLTEKMGVVESKVNTAQNTANNAVASGVPAGTIITYAGNNVPVGYLVCNGSAVSRETYANLFAAIGTIYGAGNGSSTFNLPDMSARFLEGTTGSPTYVDAGLPNITGAFIGGGQSNTYGEGCCYNTGRASPYTNADDANSRNNLTGIDASRSSGIYGKSSTVQPKALRLKMCIKY